MDKSTKFDNMSQSEMKELLLVIDDLVASFHSFATPSNFDTIYPTYTCCDGDTLYGHSDYCSIKKLQDLLGH